MVRVLLDRDRLQIQRSCLRTGAATDSKQRAHLGLRYSTAAVTAGAVVSPEDTTLERLWLVRALRLHTLLFAKRSASCGLHHRTFVSTTPVLPPCQVHSLGSLQYVLIWAFNVSPVLFKRMHAH